MWSTSASVWKQLELNNDCFGPVVQFAERAGDGNTEMALLQLRSIFDRRAPALLQLLVLVSPE